MSIGDFRTLSVAADGLSAQRHKMNVVSENIANAETTRTPEGGPYRRQRVVLTAPRQTGSFSSQLQTARLQMRRTQEGHRLPSASGPTALPKPGQFVVAKDKADPGDQPCMVYDPTHPDANPDGYVEMPNIEIVTEMVDLMAAQRAYEANLTTVEAVKQMVDKALDI
jgi:flagellar basal-body rod protein FlgC